MKQKVKVSIGIPAYNEERGITSILTDILSQSSNGAWELHEIIVMCDGCNDQTATRARSIQDSRIKVVDSKLRLGKTKRLQQLFQRFKGDVIIVLDGDVRLANHRVMNALIQALSKSDVQLVAGNVRAAKPVSFVQKAVYSTFEVFDAMRRKKNNGDNLFCCGACLALTKDFARSVSFPSIINEDVYLYLLNKQQGGKFVWAKSAVVYYKLPLNFSDYMKQIMRSAPEAVTVELQPYFPQFIDQETQRDSLSYLKEVWRAFWGNPLGVSFVIIINLVCKPFMSVVITHYDLKWFTAHSTH